MPALRARDMSPFKGEDLTEIIAQEATSSQPFVRQTQPTTNPISRSRTLSNPGEGQGIPGFD